MALLAGLRRVLARAWLVLMLSVGTAGACAICLSAVELTPGMRIDGADQVVLAEASGVGEEWAIVARLKGEGPLDMAVLAADLPPPQATAAGRAELLVRTALGQRWSGLGEVDPAHADWLRAFARSQPPDARMRGEAVPVLLRSLLTKPNRPGTGDDEMPEGSGWRERLELVAPKLDSGDGLVEALAYGELGRAPYEAIVELGRDLHAAEILERIAAEDIAARRAADILLLGGAGGERSADWVEGRLQGDLAAGTFKDLSALLAAHLELRGPARLDWVARTYLFDPARGLDAIEAALTALGVHGDADAAVPRARVVEVYRRFIRERPAMAGFVAADLLRWEEWGATRDYAALLDKGAIADPAGVFAAAAYIRSSPDEVAQAQLDRRDD